MRRLFWMGVGATVGVIVVRKVQKRVRAYTPDGLAERAGGLADSIRYFADEVRAGMAERESELRRALGIEDADADDAATDGEDAELLDHPTRHRRSAG